MEYEQNSIFSQTYGILGKELEGLKGARGIKT
jgi:hypothetical protein